MSMMIRARLATGSIGDFAVGFDADCVTRASERIEKLRESGAEVAARRP